MFDILPNKRLNFHGQIRYNISVKYNVCSWLLLYISFSEIGSTMSLSTWIIFHNAGVAIVIDLLSYAILLASINCF